LLGKSSIALRLSLTGSTAFYNESADSFLLSLLRTRDFYQIHVLCSLAMLPHPHTPTTSTKSSLAKIRYINFFEML
jgi:hypothetical protein